MDGSRTRIRVCGRLQVELDGERVEDRLRGRQGRLLLAYLVLNRARPVRRDELAGALWEHGAGDGLAPLLSRLRAALGPARLEGRGELQLVLGDRAWVDWEAAHADVELARTAGDPANARDAARRALAIADAGLLPGLEADWLDVRRTELADVRLGALEALATAGARLGGPDLAAAEQAARAAVEAAPFRESARVALMEALRAQGNAAEALRVYEDARVLLRDELGALPGPALKALHERLLREDAPPPVVATTKPAPARADLVGRDRETTELASLTREALEGDGRVVLIEGPAGIGKSRLLAEARRRAEESGARVLSAKASRLEGEFPFGVVRQLFEGVLADPPLRERALSGSAASAAPVFAAVDEGAASFAALHGLYWLTLNLAAERPLALAVDDLHWCDVASLRVIAYLARRLEGQPVLLLTTLRTGEPPTDATLVREVVTDPMTAAVRPSPLREDAVRALVADRLGTEPEPAFLEACVSTTGGNPLLIRQLLTALAADGVKPDTAHAGTVRAVGSRAIASTVLLRLDRLSPAAGAAARAVAVLGEDASLPAVAALANLDEATVGAALADLSRAEILRAEPPLEFVHPLVLDAVQSQLVPGERELAHAEAARILRERGADPDRVAAHLLLAPPRGDAGVARVLREAGEGAFRRGATDGAIAYLRRALAEPPAPEDRPVLSLQLGLAEALWDGRAAIGHLRTALEAETDPGQRAFIAGVLARALMFPGDATASVALCRRIAAELPDSHGDERRQLQAMEACAITFGGGDVHDLPGLLEPARTRPIRDYGDRCMAVMAALQWGYSGGSAEQISALALEALRGGELHERDTGLLSTIGAYALEFSERDEALPAWERERAVGHARGSDLANHAVDLWYGWSLLRRGDLRDAEQFEREALAGVERYNGPEARVVAFPLANLVDVLVSRGELHAAHAVAARLDGRMDVQSNHARYARRARLLLLVALGRHEEAVRMAERLEAEDGWVAHAADAPWRGLAATAFAALGRTEEALRHAETDLERAQRLGAPGGVGSALRVAGEVRGDLGLLESAVAVLDGSPRRLERARALTSLGAALRRADREAAARDVLTRAWAEASICGAAGLLTVVEAELAAAGGRPDPVAATGPGALTTLERRVAELKAGGHEVHGIAQAAFLTPRAVEVHLAAVERKLGGAGPEALLAALSA
jgi:DNA-binding SARP family transcriptional activator